MVKFKKTWQSRVLACALAAALTAGTAVMTPVADIVGTNITVSAKEITGSIELAPWNDISLDDIIIKGTTVSARCCGANIIIGSNTVSLPVNGIWTADKHYVVENFNYGVVLDGDSMTETKLMTLKLSETALTGTHKVTWQYDGGTVLETDTNVSYGTTPTYDGETPTKDGCIFTGWKDDNGTFYANGTVLPNVTADTTYTAVFEKELAVGTKYYIGDKFSTNGSKYIIPNNRYSDTYFYDISAVVPAPKYYQSNNYWYFDNIIRSGWGFSISDNDFNGKENVIGFRCVSGDGSSSNTAFRFELIYENKTGTCEMDFSAVAESIVSIKDADENTVALNNGKATIKTGYVITSSKPLSFPRTYAVQQDDESNFVYVIKNMIQSDKQVSYDTSAFKGKVTSYIGGVIVEGYKGTSAQLVQKGAYYGKSVSMDLSHGTRLIGQNDYYDAPLDEFFDIYNSDGKNITDLFEFSNMAVSGYANYYYYKLKQNLEDDITVFPVGTKFTLTLPEDVTLENADDIVTAKEGNKYTVRPVATAVLVSDSILSVVSSEDYLVVEPDAYKKVVNGKFVYEIAVVDEYVVNKSNIITTQGEFNNAKTGDIVMPVETLNVYTAGYRDITYSEYFNTSGYYWEGSGSGGSVDDTDYAYTIDETLSIKRNGTHEAYPVNVGKHENEEDYNVEYDKGNAWLITASNKDEEYSRRLELRGFNLALDECEFTWADNGKSATVTFNNEQPIDATVTVENDYNNKQFLCTATAVYNGITYIETQAVSFPDLADVAEIAVDYIIAGDAMPTVTVNDTTTNTILELDTDYTVSYSGDTTKPGTATVTVTAKDGSAYIGSVTKEFVVLGKAMTSTISERKKVGKNTKVTLTGTWNIPKDAQNIKGGIARLSTDDTNVTKYDVYNNGVYKTSAITSPNAKYSYSLTMNSANAAKNLFAVTYVTYEIDSKQFVSISDVSQSLISFPS